MGSIVKLSFWSDENRWFVPRALGLGYSLNLKYVARRLGWVKPNPVMQAGPDAPTTEVLRNESREERLKRQIDASRYEDSR